MDINLSLTSNYYPFFYSLAFAIGLCTFIHEGLRRRYPLTAWLLISTSVTFGLIIGSKLPSFNPANLWMLLTGGSLPPSEGRAAYAAVLFAIPCVWLVRSFLRFRQPIWDAFALFLPIIMIFQRVGCLGAGCCYGVTTSAPWGISYTGAGFLRDSQIREGIISSAELTTHQVHPVPLYFVVAAALTITLLLMLRGRLKGSGKLFALSILCMSVFRFFIEFFRHPATNQNLAGIFLGLKTIQWIIVPLAVLLIIYLYLPSRATALIPDSKPPSTRRKLILAAIFVMAAFHLKGWFTTEELFVIHAQIIFSAVICAFSHLKGRRAYRYKLAYVTLVPLMLILMGLTYPTDTTESSKPHSITIRQTYNNLGAHVYPATKIEQGCLGPVVVERDKEKPMGPHYTSFTLGAETLSEISSRVSFLMGTEGQTEYYLNTEQPYHALRGNLYLYIGTEGSRFFGFRGGVRVGSIFRDAAVIGGNKNLLPAGRMWLGYKPYFTVDLSLMDSEFTGAGPSGAEAALRLNHLGQNHPFQSVRAGIGVLRYEIDDGLPYYIFIQPSLVSTGNWTIQPQLGVTVGSRVFYNSGIGLRYSFE